MTALGPAPPEKPSTLPWAKAWVHFSIPGGLGTGPVIKASYNVDNVEWYGADLYRVTFAQPLASNEYVVTGNAVPSVLEAGRFYIPNSTFYFGGGGYECHLAVFGPEWP